MYIQVQNWDQINELPSSGADFGESELVSIFGASMSAIKKYIKSCYYSSCLRLLVPVEKYSSRKKIYNCNKSFALLSPDILKQTTYDLDN